ncbi:ankyrin repeat domain-containing protein [Xanthomonas graminis]|uniref:Ankyrin repeat protein n=1 Tax=Xanthomonas graminis pv. phlei TaxID=487906 RepID=A0A0K2ZTH4_9XANT|nr:ankyrin repeat domain-containing protein [Xanthomonas translucens]UKE64251.1 ankyrin repeat domain-containing protein [Xanthomonas translucens pv. phlei]CTP86695.1 ankyrin repeat protein [Xanthomonas translucens pv. phlei]
MPELLRALLLSFLLLTCAGCNALSVPPADQQSAYNLPSFFPDPKAQALALAAEHGNTNEIRRLMKEEHVNPDAIFSTDGYPLLMWPIMTHNPDGLRAMLENGADPNVAKPYPPERGASSTPTNHANAMVWAAKQEDPIYLKLLLDHGGNPNTRNANNETLLLQAFLTQNQWQNVKLLVERGADVNAKSQGVPILFDYASRGGFEQVYWLLEHGADPGEGSPPPLPENLSIVESIFWHPGNPNDPTWQRRCQQWLLKHGYQRPPLPESFRSMRKAFGFPYEEKDIPLL